MSAILYSQTRTRKYTVLDGLPHWVRPRGVVVDADQPAPTDPSALSFLTMTTRPTLLTVLCAADGRNVADYMLHCVNARGKMGPLSEVTTATA